MLTFFYQGFQTTRFSLDSLFTASHSSIDCFQPPGRFRHFNSTDGSGLRGGQQTVVRSCLRLVELEKLCQACKGLECQRPGRRRQTAVSRSHPLQTNESRSREQLGQLETIQAVALHLRVCQDRCFDVGAALMSARWSEVEVGLSVKVRSPRCCSSSTSTTASAPAPAQHHQRPSPFTMSTLAVFPAALRRSLPLQQTCLACASVRSFLRTQALYPATDSVSMDSTATGIQVS